MRFMSGFWEKGEAWSVSRNVGTEVGVNTDDGWVTVTFKENAL